MAIREFFFIVTLVQCEYLTNRSIKVSLKKILYTSDEDSTLQCVHKCKRFEKNAGIKFDGTKCQCIDYSEDKNKRPVPLISVFKEPKINTAQKKDKVASCQSTKTREGKCCVFPFKYKGRMHQTCLKARFFSYYWCATAPIYSNADWGRCDGDF